MDIFEKCHNINDLIRSNNESEARDELIKLLDYHLKNEINYSSLINNLIRESGLYPYIQTETAAWQDRFIHEAFKVNTGAEQPITLHREQSLLLKKLLDGESLAISAPTSFGKSFVIDSFISIKQPNNVVIIVPTIALTDETRRRLQPKFSKSHKLITTSEAEPDEKNIFIFPQERAIAYLRKIKAIDILIVDEFYKASPDFDKERSSALIKAILKLGKIAKQKYFLAPNISRLNENPFTKDMTFLTLNFNTVFLEKKELYGEINGDDAKKSDALLQILKNTTGKTLIYAGTYADIDRVSELINKNFNNSTDPLLASFSNWLSENYSKNWSLVELAKKATGIHNGQLHRSLSQIQVKLFEEPTGIRNIVSTSSIIEGVNTSAENVIIWRNRNGRSKLNDFTYRNIIGRGGRMFRHFIGKIFILDEPPKPSDTQLNLTLPDDLLGDITESDSQDLTREQIAKIISYRNEMSDLLGHDSFEKLHSENLFQSSNTYLIRDIARDMRENPQEWNGFSYLNSSATEHWEKSLYKIIKLQPAGWDIEHSKFVAFIRVISKNWTHTLPQLLTELSKHRIDVDLFFKLERNATYKLASLLNDANTLHSVIFKNSNTDISSFATKVAHAFLPSVVYQLEEYGLPRMISKKIHQNRIINLTDDNLTIHKAIEIFNDVGFNKITESSQNLDEFDCYILDYFFHGIRRP